MDLPLLKIAKTVLKWPQDIILEYILPNIECSGDLLTDSDSSAITIAIVASLVLVSSNDKEVFVNWMHWCL